MSVSSFIVFEEDIELITKTLGDVLEEQSPGGVRKYRDAQTNENKSEQFRVPVKFMDDAFSIAEYETPAIVVFNPKVELYTELVTNRDEYVDFDYTTLTAKKITEPVPVRLIYTIRTVASNPANDNVLVSFLLKLKRSLTYLDIHPVKGSDDALRVPVYVPDPTVFGSSDASKVRELEVEVWTYIYPNRWEEVRVLQAEGSVEFSLGDFTSSRTSLITRTAFNIFPDSTEVRVTMPITDFPITGTLMFTDGDTCTYTGRTADTFTGVTGGSTFHKYGSKVICINM